MKRIKSLLSLLLVLVMAVSLWACGSSKDTADSGTSAGSTTDSTGTDSTDSTDSTDAAAEGSGYVYDSVAIGTDVFGNFITGATPAESDAACSLVFDVVFKIDPDTKEAYSDILEDWYFEDDTTLIMKLKDNITFSNGDKATAEDLLYSYSSHVDRSSAYCAEFGINYDETKVIDEYTLSMKFDQFYSAFYSSYIIYLYDKSWSESVGWDSLDWYKPVGSGPYACTEYVSDDHMTFVARDDYWNKENNPVKIRQWVLKYYADSSTMFMDMEVGNIALCSMETTDYERFINNGGDGYDVYSGSAGVVYSFLYGFTENEAWYNKSVRQAIAYGIPWDELGEVVLGVNYKKATGYVPDSSPEYVNVGFYEYDLEKAKSLLAEAGYDEANPLQLHTVMMDTPFFSTCCEAFEFYCSQLGVKFTYDLKDISAAINDWMTPGAGCELGFYYDNFGSVEQMLIRSLDWAANPYGSTWTYIDEATFVEMYLEVAYETDNDKRIEKSKVTQQYLFDECLAIPFSEVTFNVAYRTDVFNINQVKQGVMNSEYYNLTNMSVASVWE